MHPLLLQLQHCWSMRRREAPPFSCQASKHYHTLLAGVSVVKYCLLRLDVDGPAACSMARSATTCIAFRRVAAADCVAHLALRTPFYAQNHDALRAWEHWSTGVVLFSSRSRTRAIGSVLYRSLSHGPPQSKLTVRTTSPHAAFEASARCQAPNVARSACRACDTDCSGESYQAGGEALANVHHGITAAALVRHGERTGTRVLGVDVGAVAA